MTFTKQVGHLAVEVAKNKTQSKKEPHQRLGKAGRFLLAHFPGHLGGPRPCI